MGADFLEREVGPAAPAMPLRKAAMLLHSMTEVDRRWMLARLAPAQRSRLNDLLAELAALDFPIDAALVRECLEAANDAEPTEALRHAGMSGWSADQAAEVLLGEPDDLIALVLRVGEWPWASALRARLGPARLSAVEASRYSMAPALSEELRHAAVTSAMTHVAGLTRDDRRPGRSAR